MPHVPGPPKPEPVEVVEVGEKPVPFLRPFDWVATALRSFRERPLPASYITQAAPGFDLFATSRLPEATVEIVAGGTTKLEVFGSKVAANKWRQYLSVDVRHDDTPNVHDVRLTRIIQDDVLGFPTLPFASAEIAPGIHFTARNVSVPPEGRIGAELDSIGIGGQLFLRALFIEYDVGEPSGDVS